MILFSAHYVLRTSHDILRAGSRKSSTLTIRRWPLLRATRRQAALRVRLLAIHVVTIHARRGHLIAGISKRILTLRLSGLVCSQSSLPKALHELDPVRILYGHRLSIRT